MEKQFLKVGSKVFNVNHITMIDLNEGRYDPSDEVWITTTDCTDGHYMVKKHTPEGKALMAWLTDSQRCQDVLAPPTDESEWIREG